MLRPKDAPPSTVVPEDDEPVETPPPVVATAPLVGLRVTEQPLGGTAVLEPCHTMATEAEPV